MRILVADKNALFLTAVSVTFGQHCELVTATRWDACMDEVQRQRFDVVIAGDKLADYAGLDLLAEVASLCPEALLIFAASPERLKELRSQLAVVGLFETVSHPLTPQKLLETLKRARQNLRARAAAKAREVVFESEWDTAEQLALREQDLRTLAQSEATATAYEPAAESQDSEVLPSSVPVAQARADEEDVSNDPIFEPPSAEAAPQWIEEGAANDSAFGSGASAPPPEVRGQNAGARKAPQSSNSSLPQKSAQAGTAKSAEESKAPARTQRRVRTQTTPTAAQRAAFERALARRNAEKSGAVAEAPSERASLTAGPPAVGPSNGGSSLFAATEKSPRSLSEFARIAATKRPLAKSNPNGPRPRRAAFAVSSGLAAVILLAILTAELRRTPHTTAHATPHEQSEDSRLFAPSPTGTLVADTPQAPDFSAPRPFTAASQPSPGFVPIAQQRPQAQTFDPGSAPPDPPPPPQLEAPGPMEPPSSMMHGTPLGMMPPGFNERPDEENDSKGWNE